MCVVSIPGKVEGLLDSSRSLSIGRVDRLGGVVGGGVLAEPGSSRGSGREGDSPKGSLAEKHGSWTTSKRRETKGRRRRSDVPSKGVVGRKKMMGKGASEVLYTNQTFTFFFIYTYTPEPE